jgi:hypothetical protein
VTPENVNEVLSSRELTALLKVEGVTVDDLLRADEATVNAFVHWALLVDMLVKLDAAGCKEKGFAAKGAKPNPCTDDPKACDIVILLHFDKVTMGNKTFGTLTPVHSVVRTQNGNWESRDSPGGAVFTADQVDEGPGKDDEATTGSYGDQYEYMWCFSCPKCSCYTDKK